MTDTPITPTPETPQSLGKELKLTVSEHTFDNLSRKANFFGLSTEELSANILLDYLAGSVGRPHISAPSVQGKPNTAGQAKLITGPSWATEKV
jgi:hypothetical protein